MSHFLHKKNISFLFVNCSLLLLCLGPFATLFFGAQTPLSPEEISAWEFLTTKELPKAFKETAFLLVGSSCGALSIGIFQAFLQIFTNIPFKKIFHILAILPMSFPIYVLAFLYVGMFDYSGMFFTFVRDVFAVNLNAYFEIKSIWGAIIVFSLCLSPYVYIFLRTSFLTIPESLIATGLSLGKKRMLIFSKIILPLSKTWIYSCLLIIMMETLADFGGVAIFNLKTFTTIIYSAWGGFFSLTLAARFSLVLITFSLIFIFLESLLLRQNHYKKVQLANTHILFILQKPIKFLFIIILILISSMAFFMPLIQLIIWALKGLMIEWDSYPYLELIQKSFSLTLLVSIGISIVALIQVFFLRVHKSPLRQLFFNLSLLGYGIPGNIIAVAIFLFFVTINNLLTTILFCELNFFVGGSLILLALGYLVRFFAVASRPLNTVAQNLPKYYESLGDIYDKSLWFRFFKIYLPHFKGSFLSVIGLVFLEILKEMPIALMLRPFNFATLSTRIYELTSEGEWERASVSGVILVSIGILFVTFINYFSNNKNEKNPSVK